MCRHFTTTVITACLLNTTSLSHLTNNDKRNVTLYFDSNKMYRPAVSNLFSLKKHSVLKISAQCTSNIAHTIKVAENIKKRRQEALVGGGKKRIEAQHKKVTLIAK